MLKVYVGNLKLIKSEINKLSTEYNLDIKFSKNILAETMYGLVYQPHIYYFLYTKELFPDKDAIERFIIFANKTNSTIICVVDGAIDKKTIFYKLLKQYITEINNTDNKTNNKELVLADLKNVYEIEDSKFISTLFSLSHSKYGQQADFVLNLILTGRMSRIPLAKKLFILLATMR